ncbi:MAG: response regulator transcription factor [Chloroflexi bacterium]|nr:response regulator transcription factor [Chloroflexota bacterium]
MAKDKTTVLIADDHGIIVQGLRLYLQRDGIDVLGVAKTGRQTIELVQALKPDVVLLDIRMPDMDGLQALSAIKDSGFKTAVIILTGFVRIEYLTRAITLGAAGFLSKDVDPERIPHAIRVVSSGDSIIDREVLQEAIREFYFVTGSEQPEPASTIQPLTKQELRVLKFVGEGLNNESIAQMLSVSRNTIKAHVSSILSKLGLSDRTQAAIWAVRRGLVD